MNPKKLAFINGKGGCGKTTSLFHVAGVLASSGEKVLVLDFDKQRNATDTLLMNSDVPNATIFDVFAGTASFEDAVAPAKFQTRGNAKAKYYNVDCIPSDVRLSEPFGDVEAFVEAFATFIAERQYSWVLVDMPPSNLLLNQLVFRYLVDFVVIPMSSDMYSVTGYSDLMDILDDAREYNPRLTNIGTFMSRYNKHKSLEQYIKDSLEQSCGTAFIDVQIPFSVDVPEGVVLGRPLSYYKLVSRSRRAYEELTAEIIRRIEKTESTR